MVNRKLIVAMASVCVLLLCFAGYLLYREMDARHVPIMEQQQTARLESVAASSPTDIPSLVHATPPDQTAIGSVGSPATDSDVVLPTTEEDSTSPNSPISAISAISGEAPKQLYDFGSITIMGKTYEVKKGIDEATLKRNIGWMESSALPGEEGTTVLMGHRNTQLRILKDIMYGDEILFTSKAGDTVTYKVASAKIVQGDELLSFASLDEDCLVLLTCYPFYYKGHAPDQFVVTAIMQ